MFTCAGALNMRKFFVGTYVAWRVLDHCALQKLSPLLLPGVQCQACFLSRKAASEQEDITGEVRRHLPSHDMTRIMGKPAVPDGFEVSLHPCVA